MHSEGIEICWRNLKKKSTEEQKIGTFLTQICIKWKVYSFIINLEVRVFYPC